MIIILLSFNLIFAYPLVDMIEEFALLPNLIVSISFRAILQFGAKLLVLPIMCYNYKFLRSLTEICLFGKIRPQYGLLSRVSTDAGSYDFDLSNEENKRRLFNR
jgi:hypothetical protein